MQSIDSSTRRLFGKISVAALVPAIVAGVYTGVFLHEVLSQSGHGLLAVGLAVAGAIALTVTYAACVHGFVTGIAPLPREERARHWPTLVAGVGIIMLASAYPNIIVSGGGQAAGIEDRAYIARLAAIADSLKRAAQSADQIEGVIRSGAVQLDTAAQLESSGGLSGAMTSGALAEAIRSKGGALLAVAHELATPREKVADEIARIDQAIDRMRAALIDTSLTPERRRVLMQRYGDEARSAAIAIATSTPLATLQTLADGLMGPQIEPVWSAKADIRKKQEEGFRKYKDELRRLGRALARHTTDLAQALKVSVPVYDPPPPSILVIKHASALTSIYAFAIALDGLPFILYLVACALSDASRRRITESLADEPRGLSATETPLGPHPYPHATRARSTTPGGRRNGEAALEDQPR